MRLSFKASLWLLISAGTLLSTLLAFAFFGNGFDVDNMGRVGAELSGPAPFELYSEMNQGLFYRYPYPPGFFPWIGASTFVANHSPVPFHGLIQVPMILANAGIALVVQAYLGARGATDRTRLIATAAVVLGPVFVGISGYHGQVDALAFLPAVVALVVWESRTLAVVELLGLRGRATRLAARLDADLTERALATGTLIGLGAAVKTVPLFLLVALVPTARRLSAAAMLVVSAIAVPLLLLVPFLIADPDGVVTLTDYSGAPGLGGLGLALQPDLVIDWLVRRPLEFSAVSDFLRVHADRVVQLVLLAVFATVVRYRPAPRDAVVFLWVAFYAFSPNFFFQYLIWGIPFFLMAGYLRNTVLLQAAVFIPMVTAFLIPWSTGHPAALYVPLMLGVWVVFVVALVQLFDRMRRDSVQVGHGRSAEAQPSGAMGGA